jgi:hypothetical protein
MAAGMIGRLAKIDIVVVGGMKGESRKAGKVCLCHTLRKDTQVQAAKTVVESAQYKNGLDLLPPILR